MERIGRDSLALSVAGRLTFLHWGVVVLSLVVTIGAWTYSKQQVENRTLARFNAARDQTVGLIGERMQKYEDALWAGVSTVHSHGGDASRDQWRAFAANLQIEQKYPGINGIGIVHFLKPGEMPAYLVRRRREAPGFTVFPPHGHTERMPISFIEPEAPNAQAVGLDVAHETNRRLAAQRSRDTGQANISGPIILVQDAARTPGFLFYAPFYHGTPTNQAERREQSIGAVYAPFVVRKLVEGLLAKERRDVRFSIHDADQAIYDEHDPSDPLFDPDPLFAERVELDLYGRNWVIDIRSDLGFRASNTYAQPTIILIGGILIDGLLLALFLMLSGANRRAVAYADRVTAALKREKAKLAATNEELEQFAYVASHDLKTPIRGIGGLTEMVLEDLEAYFKTPGADPEVRANLNRIQERVRRMNDLTRGILEYSRIGEEASSDAAVDLGEIVASLIADFDLAPEQIALAGPMREVTFDPLNFRRVVENLIGNAVKYHHDRDTLLIEVRTVEVADSVQMTIIDNGPGIDPRFHNRIFDVFQKLHTGGAVEGSGIGLSIVKRSVERHGGQVTLKSMLGEGAVFSFDWPRHAPRSLEDEKAKVQDHAA